MLETKPKIMLGAAQYFSYNPQNKLRRRQKVVVGIMTALLNEHESQISGSGAMLVTI